MPVNEPVTIWSPPDRNAEITSPGATNLTDTTGSIITDTTQANITDTGILETLSPSTIYGENDAE